MGKENSQMNILIVSTDFPPQKGGISTYSHELSAALSRQKNTNVFVLACGVTEYHKVNNRHPYTIIRTPSVPIIRILAMLFYLPWLIIRFRINVVLHTVWPSSLISHFWFLLFPRPYFVSVHASEIIDDRRSWRRTIKYFLKPWRQVTLKKAHGIFPVSQYTKGLLKRYGIPEERIKIISNGVDHHRFKPPVQKKTAKDKILLTVARLDLHKGHDQVLKALALLKEEGITPLYWIAGSGEEKTRLHKLTKKLGIERQVSFLGFINDDKLLKIYHKADIFIMTSRKIFGRGDLIEGFGIAFLEASACGIPIIAGHSGGVEDAVCDGRTGILVDPDNPSEIANSIKHLMFDEELSKKLGAAGRVWVESHMTWDRVSKRMISAMRNLCVRP